VHPRIVLRHLAWNKPGSARRALETLVAPLGIPHDENKQTSDVVRSIPEP